MSEGGGEGPYLDGSTFRQAVYRSGALDTPQPAALPMLAGVQGVAGLKPRPAVDWTERLVIDGPLGNDVHSNCVPIAVLRLLQLHAAEVWHDSWVPTEAETLALYDRWSADRTYRHGIDPNAALADISAHGYQIGGREQARVVPRWFGVGLSRLDHLRLAIDLAGGVLLTMRLPVAGTSLVAWDVPPPGTPGAEFWGVHEVLCARYDEGAYYITTWAERGIPCSPHALLAWTLRADVLASRAWLDTTGKTPRGTQWTDMIAALSTF